MHKFEGLDIEDLDTLVDSLQSKCSLRESMPRGMAGKTMIKQRDLLKETKDFSSCKFILSEGESIVHEKAETSETSGNSMLQHKNTKASSNIKKKKCAYQQQGETKNARRWESNIIAKWQSLIDKAFIGEQGQQQQ